MSIAQQTAEPLIATAPTVPTTTEVRDTPLSSSPPFNNHYHLMSHRHNEPSVETSSSRSWNGISNIGATSATVEWNLDSSNGPDAHHVPPVAVLPQTATPQHTNIQSNTNRRNGLVMQIRTQTWIADSHGLFDYESRNVLLSEFKCACMRESYHIARIGTDVRFLPTTEAEALYTSDPRAKGLAQIVWTNGHYCLAPIVASGSREEHLWLVVRHLRDRCVTIVPGDVLKLGRFRLKVKEIVLSPREAKGRRFLCCTEDDDDCETVAPEPGDTAVEFDGIDSAGSVRGGGGGGGGTHHQRNISHVDDETHETTIAAASSMEHQEEEEIPSSPTCDPPPQISTVEHATYQRKLPQRSQTFGPRTCRICLCEADEDCENSNLNPLVAPCECKGSMRWVHLQCLRTWMAGRLNIRSEGVSFFWRSLECELCKVSYPAVVKVYPDRYYSEEEDEEIENNNPVKFNERRNGKESSDNREGKTPDISPFNESTENVLVENSNIDNSNEHSLVATNANKAIKQPLEKPQTQQFQRHSKGPHSSSRPAVPRTVELFEIPRPDVPYAILEPRTQQNKGLHIVSLANNRVARLGRGHESDIRLADISVSRLHSVLRFQPPNVTKRMSNLLVGSSGYGPINNDFAATGCFIVEDNRSKFGTLVELRRPFRLDPNCPAISVQIGRSVITISLKRRWRLRMPACIRHHSSDIYVVFRQPQIGSTTAPTTTTTAVPATAASAASAASAATPASSSISNNPVVGPSIDINSPRLSDDRASPTINPSGTPISINVNRNEEPRETTATNTVYHTRTTSRIAPSPHLMQTNFTLGDHILNGDFRMDHTGSSASASGSH